MIDVAHYKAEIAALPGDNLIVPRAQVLELLGEVEIGQAARRALVSMKTITAALASASGAFA